MSIYQYRCDKCNNIFDVAISLALIDDLAKEHRCSTCGNCAYRVFTAPNINLGVKSRVYYQWKGDPNKCPSDLRDSLKNQKELPQGINEFVKEGEPALGTGQSFKGGG